MKYIAMICVFLVVYGVMVRATGPGLAVLGAVFVAWLVGRACK